MRFARVALMELKPNTFDTNLQKARTELMPLFRSQQGFVSYQVLKTGERSALSIVVFETRAAAESADRVATGWARQSLADTIVSMKSYVAEIQLDSQSWEQPELHP